MAVVFVTLPRLGQPEQTKEDHDGSSVESTESAETRGPWHLCLSRGFVFDLVAGQQRGFDVHGPFQKRDGDRGGWKEYRWPKEKDSLRRVLDVVGVLGGVV